MSKIKEDKNDKNNKILNISFNQDNSCFSIGKENGFIVYETFPLKNQYEKKMDGGIKIAEMYYKTNVLALIGGGENPKYNPKKLNIWDDSQNKIASEIKFFSILRNVKLKKDKIYAICDKNIYVFDLKTFENLEIIPTRENSKGLFSICGDPNKEIIAYIEKADKENKQNFNKYFVMIKNYNKNTSFPIFALEEPISYISLNYDGTLLAVSNEKGTQINIHSCTNGNILAQFYRGKDKAEINHICFDKFSNFLAVSSAKGTVHIWSLGGVFEKLKVIEKDNLIQNEPNKKEIEKDEDNKINLEQEKDDEEKENNLKEALPKNKKVLFKQTEKSFAQIRVNPNKCICCFQKNNIIIVVSYDGSYYQAQLDTKNGGNCKIIFQESLYNLKKDD